NEFLKHFCEQFEDTDPSLIKAETKFREELEEWDSLTAMSVIAMADSEYGVTLTGDDIRNSKTVEDLFTLVKSKK
ncbi:MAG: acyl carrier protein, partial [Bacteroidetes bacterium]